MVPINVIPFPEVQYSSRCGTCPECGKTDGYVNLGKEHWFVCRDHKTKWLGGYNLFENWKNQTVSQTESVNLMLEDFLEVLPYRVSSELKQASSN